jgi:hypothetical protein
MALPSGNEAFRGFRMVERRIELGRRYHRKKKLPKLKRKLEAAKTDGDREKILHKIRALSPLWTPAENK